VRKLSFAAACFALLIVGAPAPAGAGGFCSDGDFSDARGTTVTMKKYCFEPAVIRVQPGDKVTFLNDDAQSHAVGGIMNVFGNMHTEVKPGDSVSYRFRQEGTFPYVCIFHPGMGGAVVVGDGEGKHVGRVASPVLPSASDEAGGAHGEPVASSATASDEDPQGQLIVVVVAVGALVGALTVAVVLIRRYRGRAAVTSRPAS
jgi:plastocyanin